jgi:hypothetical protein
MVRFSPGRSVSRRVADAASRSARAASHSADAARESARVASQERRDGLEREINITAHRVIQTAGRVKQGAVEVVAAYQNLHVAAGQGANPQNVQPVQVRAEARVQAANEKAAAAQTILDAGPEQFRKLDTELAADLRELDKHLVQLEGLREELSDEMVSVKDKIRTIQDRETAMRAAQMVNSGRAPPFTR